MRIVLYIAHLLMLPGFTPPVQEDCKAPLLRYYEQLAKVGTPEGRESYYMEMTVKNTLSSFVKSEDTDKGNEPVHLKLFLNRRMMAYESAFFSSYVDEENAIMVLHPQKKIIWNNAGKNAAAANDPKKVAAIQERIITESKVRYCKDIVFNDREMQLIDMEPSPEIRKKDNIRYVTFYLDKKKQEVHKVVLSYEVSSEVKRQEITYDVINFDYNQFKGKNAKSFIFRSGTTLRTEYDGYVLEDHRETK